jgi:hypothetical protein
MWNRSCIDSIHSYKSAVYLSIYRGGGLDPLQTNFRAFPVILANNRNTKLGTLICFAHARTVRTPGADCPDRGPSDLRAGPSARLNSVLNSDHPTKFEEWTHNAPSHFRLSDLSNQTPLQASSSSSALSPSLSPRGRSAAAQQRWQGQWRRRSSAPRRTRTRTTSPSTNPYDGSGMLRAMK